MSHKLEDIHPRRVSLVKRGANLRRILLAKADENLDDTVSEILAAPVAKEAAALQAFTELGGDETVIKAAATAARALDALDAAFADQPDEIRKAARRAMADMAESPEDSMDMNDDTEPDADDELAKARFEEFYKADQPTEEQRREWAKQGIAMPDGSYYIRNRDDLEHAIHAVGRGSNNSHADIRAHIVRRAKALGATSMLPDSWNVQKEDGMTETALPVKKEDGTWDLTAVPEDSRATVEAILKARDDELEQLRKEKEAEQTKADEAIQIAKAEREHRERQEHIAKAHELANLAKSADELGDLLYAIAKAEQADQLPEGTSQKLDELLKAANEAAAPVFKEAGRVGRLDGNDGVAKVEAIAKTLREADPTLTREQAFVKALEQNPDLYAETKE